MPQESVNQLLRQPLYATKSNERRRILLSLLREVCAHHMERCPPYGRLCKKRGVDPQAFTCLEDIPYLPTSLFKDTLLLSIPETEVFRELRSSATTQGRPSRIGLDRENNHRWSLSMQRMLMERIGDERLRMLILDEPAVLARSEIVPARASMTRSLLFAASEVETCIKSEEGGLRLDREKLDQFVENNPLGTGAMLFGFTFILSLYVVKPLLEAGKTFQMPNLKILHAGGWKKLQELSISPEQLLADCVKCFGIAPENLVDIYGFTEQGGLLYPTCEHGVRHTPLWSEVICRDPLTLEPLPPGKEGLMQFLTPIQTSYPGHSVITEDIGLIVGTDDCPCGRMGTTFVIRGRSGQATEERGCGDIMAELFA